MSPTSMACHGLTREQGKMSETGGEATRRRGDKSAHGSTEEQKIWRQWAVQKSKKISSKHARGEPKKSVASTKDGSSSSGMSAGVLDLASVSSGVGNTQSRPCSICAGNEVAQARSLRTAGEFSHIPLPICGMRTHAPLSPNSQPGLNKVRCVRYGQVCPDDGATGSPWYAHWSTPLGSTRPSLSGTSRWGQASANTCTAARGVGRARSQRGLAPDTGARVWGTREGGS